MISLSHNGVFSLLYIIDTANHNIAHQYRSRIGDLDGLVSHHSLGKHKCPPRQRFLSSLRRTNNRIHPRLLSFRNTPAPSNAYTRIERIRRRHIHTNKCVCITLNTLFYNMFFKSLPSGDGDCWGKPQATHLLSSTSPQADSVPPRMS